MSVRRPVRSAYSSRRDQERGLCRRGANSSNLLHPVGIYLRKVTRPCAGYRMGIAGCALGRVNVCRSGFRSSLWWSALRRWSSRLTPRTTAAQRTQSASWPSARTSRVTSRRVSCLCELGVVLVRGRQRAREGAQRGSAATWSSQRNEANLVDVSPRNDCGGVGGHFASPAGASQGRTRQGLALRTMESTTEQHSERVIEPLWF